jgi:hypothetical protein
MESYRSRHAPDEFVRVIASRTILSCFLLGRLRRLIVKGQPQN